MLLDSHRQKEYNEWDRVRYLAFTAYKCAGAKINKPTDLFKLHLDPVKEVKPDAERAIEAFKRYKKIKENG